MPSHHDTKGASRAGRTGELFYREADSVFVTSVTTTGGEPTIAPTTLLLNGKDFVSAPFEPLWDVSPDGQRFVFVRDPQLGGRVACVAEHEMTDGPGL